MAVQAGRSTGDRRGRRRIEAAAGVVAAIFLFLAVAPLPVVSDPSATREDWTLLANPGVAARFRAEDGLLRVEVHRLKRRQPSEVRLERPLAVKKGERWTVSFQVRSDEDRTAVCRLNQGVSPWNPLAPEQTFPVAVPWTSQRLEFVAAAEELDARVQFLIGAVPGVVEFRDVQIHRSAAKQPSGVPGPEK